MKVKEIAELNYNQKFRVDLYNCGLPLLYIRTERGDYYKLTTEALNAEVATINACDGTIWMSAVRGYENA